MAAIELGQLPVAGQAAPEPPEHRSSVPRSLVLAALVVVLLGTLTGAAPVPRPPAQATVPARLGATAFTGADRIFVADPAGDASGGRWLSAYRLPDAAPLWRVSVPLAGAVGGTAVIGGTLVLTVDWSPAERRETVGLDLATGAFRWRRAATFEGVTDTGDLLLWDAPGEPLSMDDPPGTLRAVSADTAAVRWSLPLPGGALRSYRYGRLEPGEPVGLHRGDGPVPVSALVVSRPEGRVQVHDVGTGRVRRALELPDPDPGHAAPIPRVAGDLLLVDRGWTVTAYGLDLLEHRWRTSSDPGREFRPIPCAAYLCFYGRHGGVRVVDPGTGRTRWADERWELLTLAGGHLVAAGSGRPGIAPLNVLDPATGRVLVELGRWQLLRSPPGATRPIGVRVGPDGRAWVAELDPVTGTARIVMALRGVSGECEAGPGVFFCRRLDGSVGIWAP